MKTSFLKIKTIGIASLLCLSLSCSKEFLEITPKGKLIAKSVADYDLLLSNLDLLNMYTDAQVLMGDEVSAIEPFFSGAELRTQRLFRWDDVVYEPDEDAPEMGVPMNNIYLFNKIITEIEEATEGTESKKKAILAEARAGRAWTYHLLINYYGKPYDASTAATDLGIPIIKNADVTKTEFNRASVQEVYDFIVEDLTASIPDLPDGPYHRFRMSKPTAEALLGKVYIEMGKFEEAERALSASLRKIASAQIPVNLYDYNLTFAPDGEFMPIGLFGPEYPSTSDNAENLFAKQFINNWAFTDSEIVITPETKDLYTSTDLRLNFYANAAFMGDTYPNGLHRRIGPIATQMGMLLSDIYLMRAECLARLGKLSESIADVEFLRKHRMAQQYAAVPSSVGNNQENLVRFILEERIREFAGQGYRWYDMRRLSVDPIYQSTVGYNHILYEASGQVGKTFTLKPERLVLRFPEKLMIQNPGMNNNP